MYNKYSIYSMIASEIKNLNDNKILADLDYLKTLDNYNAVLDFLDKNYGKIDKEKYLEFENNIAVFIYKENYSVEIIAAKDKKQIFGKGWKFIPSEDNKKQNET